MLAILLGLTVSGCLGVSDFIAGTKSRRLPVWLVIAFSQVIGLLLLLIAAAIVRPPIPDFATVATAIGAGFAACVGTVALYRGLAVGTMSVVAPVSACSAGVPVLAGVVAGESPATLQYAGMAVAIVGVMLAAHAGEAAGGDASCEGRVAGVGLALLAALGGGLFIVAMSGAAKHNLVGSTFVARATVLGLLAAGWAARGAVRQDLAVRKLDGGLVAIGALETGSWLMLGAAASRGLLSVVGVLVSLYPAVTVALARLVHNERLAPEQVAGIVAIFAGVGLLSAA